MSGRRSTVKSDILSGLGVVFEFVRVMRALDVTDEDFRAVLSNKARAAEVAAVLRRNHPETATFAELLTAGRFNFVNELFGSEYDSRWTNKGDRVRGSYCLLRMSGTYREGDLAAALAAEGGRIGKTLFLATAYELAHYASNGWNGHDVVVAWGSSCVNPDGYRCVAYLWCDDAQRKLRLFWAVNAWSSGGLVLCVCE